MNQCPRCAAQAARNATLQEEIAGLRAEVAGLQA